ncbi:amidohydrolase [Dehalobacter sp. DCM]|nr:amidohydrolase [Dehalobacter sp. DCM]
MEAIVGQTQANLAKIICLAEEAAGNGVDILCFPEMSLHGYSTREAVKLAEPISGDNVRKISECAVRLGMTLLVGMAEETGSGKPYLTHIVAFASGEIGAYRKTHLGRSESNYFTPGQEFPVFQSHGTNFGIGICWDWHFPEVGTIYSLKGAEVLFAPHASPKIIGDRKEIWLRYLRARAYDNSVYFGACNLLGQNGMGQEFQGGALLLNPKGEILAEQFNGKGILTCELAAEPINCLRQRKSKTMKELFFLAYRQKDLYRELLDLEVSENNANLI